MMSRQHKICVLAHPESRTAVERQLAQHPNPNLRFEWVSVPKKLDPWRPDQSLTGIHLHYLLWQFAVLRRARQLLREDTFDIVHHVGWGTVGAAPPYWKLGLPFIWGPVGGAQVTPAAFTEYFEGQRFREVLRSIRIRLISVTPGIRRAARHSAVILATNNETLRLLRALGAANVLPFLDCGTDIVFPSATGPVNHEDHEITILWAGYFEGRKALPLALEALALKPDLPVRLRIAGDGPMNAAWRRRARQLQVDSRVEFLGWVPWEQMRTLYRTSSIFMFTSLRDSFGNVIAEAMSNGLPLIALDHNGVGSFVPTSAGIKVPVTNPQETVSRLADALELLCRNPEMRRRAGAAAQKFARQHTWDRRAEAMNEIYEQVRRPVDRK